MISIEYLEVGASESVLVTIASEFYFDEHQEQSFDHAHQFLGLEPTRLCWTLLNVPGETGYRIRTQYLPDDGGWMTHRIDADGSEEIIHFVCLRAGGELVMKTTKPHGGQWMMIGCDYPARSAESDMLKLRSFYKGDSLMPADVPGSFATVLEPVQARKGPWPARKT